MEVRFLTAVTKRSYFSPLRSTFNRSSRKKNRTSGTQGTLGLEFCPNLDCEMALPPPSAPLSLHDPKEYTVLHNSWCQWPWPRRSVHTAAVGYYVPSSARKQVKGFLKVQQNLTTHVARQVGDTFDLSFLSETFNHKQVYTIYFQLVRSKRDWFALIYESPGFYLALKANMKRAKRCKLSGNLISIGWLKMVGHSWKRPKIFVKCSGT